MIALSYIINDQEALHSSAADSIVSFSCAWYRIRHNVRTTRADGVEDVLCTPYTHDEQSSATPFPDERCGAPSEGKLVSLRLTPTEQKTGGVTYISHPLCLITVQYRAQALSSNFWNLSPVCTYVHSLLHDCKLWTVAGHLPQQVFGVCVGGMFMFVNFANMRHIQWSNWAVCVFLLN